MILRRINSHFRFSAWILNKNSFLLFDKIDNIPIVVNSSMGILSPYLQQISLEISLLTQYSKSNDLFWMQEKPLNWKRKSSKCLFNSECCTIRLGSLRLSKIRKLAPLILFDFEQVCLDAIISNNSLCQNLLAAIFEKKFFANTSVSPTMKLKTRKWPPWPASSALGFFKLLNISIFQHLLR